MHQPEELKDLTDLVAEKIYGGWQEILSKETVVPFQDLHEFVKCAWRSASRAAIKTVLEELKRELSEQVSGGDKVQ